MDNANNTKKPFYKRAWFIVLVVLFVFYTIGNSSNRDSVTDREVADSDNVDVVKSNVKVIEEEPKELIVTTAKKLFNDLNKNALKAEKTWQDAYVKVTGKLVNIDSDGNYFTISSSDIYSFEYINCYINAEHEDKVMEFTDGQNVTVIGDIVTIGEIVGYAIDVESIE